MADNIVANDKIKWETTTITDVGFDASFWKGRISITFRFKMLEKYRTEVGSFLPIILITKVTSRGMWDSIFLPYETRL